MYLYTHPEEMGKKCLEEDVWVFNTLWYQLNIANV